MNPPITPASTRLERIRRPLQDRERFVPLTPLRRLGLYAFSAAIVHGGMGSGLATARPLLARLGSGMVGTVLAFLLTLASALELHPAVAELPGAWSGRCVERTADGPPGSWAKWAVLALLALLELGLLGIALTAPKTGEDADAAAT